MIPTRLQATPLTDGKVSKFTMKENVQLSPVTDIREHIGTKKTFLAGGTIDGVPVKGKVYGLKKGGWAFMQSGVGIVVDSPEGVYIVPFSKVETHSSVDGKGVVDTVTDEAKEAVSDFR